MRERRRTSPDGAQRTYHSFLSTLGECIAPSSTAAKQNNTSVITDCHRNWQMLTELNEQSTQTFAYLSRNRSNYSYKTKVDKDI